MDDNELKDKLESLSTPDVTRLHHGASAKLAILSFKKSTKLTWWLLLIPFLVLFSAFLQSTFKVILPPWSWIQQFSPGWPIWIRFGVYFLILILIPSVVVILNLLSIVWINYDRTMRVLQISVRLRTFNIVVIAVASLLALLFIGHSLIDC